MTLEEAIEYCKIKMDSQGNYNSLWYSQLYNWLVELKNRREKEKDKY